MSKTAVFNFLSGAISNEDSIGCLYDGPILTQVTEVLMKPESAMIEFATQAAEMDAVKRTGSIALNDINDKRLLLNYMSHPVGVSNVKVVRLAKTPRLFEDNLRWELLIDGPGAAISLSDNALEKEGPSFDGIKRILWETGIYVIQFANQEYLKDAAQKTGWRTSVSRNQNELVAQIVDGSFYAYHYGQRDSFDLMRVAFN